MKRYVLIAAMAALAAACGDSSTEPRVPSATGSWTGTAVGVTVNANLAEDDNGVVTGNGTFSGPGGSLAFNVENGVHNHPSISFTITASGAEDASFSGSFTDDDTMSGTMHGSGFNGETMVLTRN